MNTMGSLKRILLFFAPFTLRFTSAASIIQEKKIQFIGGPEIAALRFFKCLLEMKSLYEYKIIENLDYIKDFNILWLVVHGKVLISIWGISSSLLYYDSYVSGIKGGNGSFFLVYVSKILLDFFFLVCILIIKNIHRDKISNYIQDMVNQNIVLQITKSSKNINFNINNLVIYNQKEIFEYFDDTFNWLIAPQIYGLIQKAIETYIYSLNYKKLKEFLLTTNNKPKENLQIL